jgi:universal stress protein E
MRSREDASVAFRSQGLHQMLSLRKILVPVRVLNGRSHPAVLKAAQLARAHGAGLELFHVLTAEMYPAPMIGSQKFFTSFENEARQTAIRRLEAIADRLRMHSIKVTVSARWDLPAHEAIIRRAQEIKADLIVAAQHAGRHRMPWLMQLTDWELIRHSPVPLLLVKSPHPYRRPTILAAIDPHRANEKPRTLDREILRIAATWTSLLHGQLHAVHSYGSLRYEMAAEDLTPAMLVAMQRKAKNLARRRMMRTVAPQRIARARQHLSALPPADAITSTARQVHSTIVVLGVVSRTAIKRLLIGSTAERVLDSLPCDLLIVKPRDFKNRVPSKGRGVPYSVANDLYPYPLMSV